MSEEKRRVCLVQTGGNKMSEEFDRREEMKKSMDLNKELLNLRKLMEDGKVNLHLVASM